MKNTHARNLLRLAAFGLVGGLASAASGQTLINVSGATLLSNFLRSQAITNDYLDCDGDGIAARLGTGTEQLAFSVTVPPSSSDTWTVTYRAVGSINGFQELVDFGSTFVTTGDNIDIKSNVASAAFYNRQQYITNQVPGGLANILNPGASPVRSTTAGFVTTSTSAPNGIRIDIAPVDVPSFWVVRGPAGTAVPALIPGQAGYGRNPKLSLNKTGTTSGAGLDNLLANLGSRSLFNPANPGAANANTIFDTQLAFAPVVPIVNFGVGLEQIDVSDLRHLQLSGRRLDGENLMVVTRDSGSGTRNAFNSSLCLDPSWGVGENVGGLNTSDILGPNFLPSNKNGGGNNITTTRNHRLAIGYAGGETAVNSPSWGTGGALEILSVKFDLTGGTTYVRPQASTIFNNNSSNTWRIGGPAIFATLGDPQASPPSKGGVSNGRPQMLNQEAACFINNITASVTAFSAAPGGADTLFTPGEFLAVNFIPTAALDFLPTNNPCVWQANAGKNVFLQNFVKGASVYNNSFFTNPWGTVSRDGKVPTRATGTVYSDSVANGANYITQGGVNVNYGTNLDRRNRIAGDFNGDGLRTIDDSADMVAAWRQRNGGQTWIAPNGSGAIAGASGNNAVIEILGDFNGDGSFNSADVRYAADGLYKNSCGRVDRRLAFIAIDDSFGGNFFGTTLATGKTYVSGDSAGDIAGAVGTTPGFAPVGSDGVVNAKDIDYIYKQFKTNSAVTDGQSNWASGNEAANSDLSADINGDLIIDQRDVCYLVRTILGTRVGDVNLNGVKDAADRAIIVANQSTAGGWARGDLNGDGAVDATDLDIFDGNQCLCQPADYNGDAFVDAIDYDLFISDWLASDCRADFNFDGFVDAIDYDGFISAWLTVACDD